MGPSESGEGSVLVGEAAPRLGREGKGITSNMINSSPYIESDGGLISSSRFILLIFFDLFEGQISN